MTVIEIKQAFIKGEFTAQRALGEVRAMLIVSEEKIKADALKNGKLIMHDLRNVFKENDGKMENFIYSNDTIIHPSSEEALLLLALEKELEEYIENHPLIEPNTEPITSIAEPIRELEPIGKIVWKWGKADLAWLYSTLMLYCAINCSPSAFASLFFTMDMEPMPSSLLDYQKGEAPRRQAMKDINDAIPRHKPGETRN